MAGRRSKAYKSRAARSAKKLGMDMRAWGRGRIIGGWASSLGGYGVAAAGAIAGASGVGVPVAVGGVAAGVGLNVLGAAIRRTGREMRQTGLMIQRQGANVAKSPRMAETLSMASLMTGVRGPQSEGGPGAYLNGKARAKAAKAPTPRAAPVASPAPGKSKGPAGRQSYTTADGRTVQGTAGQVAAWRGRRK